MYYVIYSYESYNKYTFNVKTFTFCDEKSIFSSKWYVKWKLWVHWILGMDMEWGIMSVWVSCVTHIVNLAKSVNNASKSLNERMSMSTYVFQLIIIMDVENVKNGARFRLKIFHFNHCSDNVFDFWLFSLSANNEGARDCKKIYERLLNPQHTCMHFMSTNIWLLRKEVSIALTCNLLKRFSLH